MGASEAFAEGYALYGTGDLSDRAKRTYRFVSGMEDAQFVSLIGEQEGLYTSLYMRRDRLWMKYDRKIQAWCHRFSLKIDFNGQLQDAARGSYNRAEAAATLIQLFRSILHDEPELAADLRDLIRQAISDAQSEGITAAGALFAHHKGDQVPDLAQLKQDVAVNAKARQTSGVGNGVTVVLAGMAGDSLDAAHNAALNNGNQQDQEDAAQNAIAAGTGSSFYLDGLVHQFYILAALATFDNQGVQYADFVTVGDDKVCATCDAYEVGSPYRLDDVPAPPVHAGCRCWVVPADGP